MAALDSAATAHFLMTTAACRNIRPTTNRIRVLVANGKYMTSTHEGDISIPGLPPEACTAHMFEELAQGSGSLISLGQLCDSNCTAIFDANSVNIFHNGTRIIEGFRTHRTGLWHIPINPPPGFPPLFSTPTAAATTTEPPILPTLHMASAAHFDASVAQQVAFSHAVLFSPVLSTLQRALDNYFIDGFPGINSKSLKRHPPQSKATTKGHMDQL